MESGGQVREACMAGLHQAHDATNQRVGGRSRLLHLSIRRHVPRRGRRPRLQRRADGCGGGAADRPGRAQRRGKRLVGSVGLLGAVWGCLAAATRAGVLDVVGKARGGGGCRSRFP